MKHYETFGQCLQRVLTEMGLSASEAARLVKFRSRTSIFRILNDDTSCEVDERFMTTLRAQVADWPQRCWDELEEALEIKRVGREQYTSNCAFYRVMHSPEAQPQFLSMDNQRSEPMNQVLSRLLAQGKNEMIVTGCCDAALSRMLARCCAAAGDAGRLSIRHYIDMDDEVVVQNILGVLPLVGKTWYNARLVDHQTCPEEMLTLYRMNSIILHPLDDARQAHQFIRYDPVHFMHHTAMSGAGQAIALLDHWRFQLELLKPLPIFGGEADAFVEYTANYQYLEQECPILSIKPDIHFNCIPCHILEPAIREGFSHAGIADGDELNALMDSLARTHEARYRNITEKRSATHLVYSLPAMIRFMETGVQTDHFFLQRAYSPQERRGIMETLRDTMDSNPYFHVHFLKEDVPALCNEITLYKGKGVMLMDAYSDYDLCDDHSEAMITQPVFMDRFNRFYMEVLLQKHVLSRARTLEALDRLILMFPKE